MPSHIAITLGSPSIADLSIIIKKQIESNLKILTLDLRNLDDISQFLKQVKELFIQYKIKVSFFGKWYDFIDVELIKAIIEDTKEFDNLSLNLVLNYDGQEEIVDACKIIARLHTSNKISTEQISKESIKEHIYTSNFPVPEVIYLVDTNKADFLLWDSSSSKIKIIKNITEIEF